MLETPVRPQIKLRLPAYGILEHAEIDGCELEIGQRRGSIVHPHILSLVITAPHTPHTEKPRLKSVMLGYLLRTHKNGHLMIEEMQEMTRVAFPRRLVGYKTDYAYAAARACSLM